MLGTALSGDKNGVRSRADSELSPGLDTYPRVTSGPRLHCLSSMSFIVEWAPHGLVAQALGAISQE